MSSEPQLPPNILDLTGIVDCKFEYRKAYHGGLSDVFEGDYHGRIVAVKVLRITKKDELEAFRRRFAREAKTWTVLSNPGHPNVLQFFGIMDWKDERPAFISPFQKNGTVMQYIAKNQQADRYDLVLGVSWGLQYIHQHYLGVAHGDLKSNNVLIDDRGTPLITDFGQSRLFDDEDYITQTGHKHPNGYLAPEIFVARAEENVHIDPFSVTTQAADIYAFSIIAFEVLSGKLYSINSNGIYRKVVERLVRPPEGVISEGYFALLVQCWEADPGKRLKIDAIVRKLERMRR